jgi:uncharacterized protein YjbI with pentapeptide repeats
VHVLASWAKWPRGIRWGISVLAAAVALAAVGWVLFVPVADSLASHDVGQVTGALRTLRLQTARDAARGRLLTFGAGLFAAAALLFTARNFSLSREGQVTDRYTKAIEQLGSDKLDVRLGGIYALERVARDSSRDHPTVMEVLAAFIREHSHDQWPPTPPDSDAVPQRKTRPDVQGGLTVISRRNSSTNRGPVDLTGANLDAANLAGANLAGAFLDGANLAGAHLGGADLTRALLAGANLYGANLYGAHLAGANLGVANLTRANLTGANLTKAHLTGADLTGAELYGAPLTGAFFTGARFTGARLTWAFLTGASLAGADLAGTDLSQADLAGANLYEANLTKAHLTGADLTGADLSGADLSGAVWPENLAPPLGWEQEPDQRRLKRVSKDPGATPQPEV